MWVFLGQYESFLGQCEPVWDLWGGAWGELCWGARGWERVLLSPRALPLHHPVQPRPLHRHHEHGHLPQGEQRWYLFTKHPKVTSGIVFTHSPLSKLLFTWMVSKTFLAAVNFFISCFNFQWLWRFYWGFLVILFEFLMFFNILIFAGSSVTIFLGFFSNFCSGVCSDLKLTSFCPISCCTLF